MLYRAESSKITYIPQAIGKCVILNKNDYMHIKPLQVNKNGFFSNYKIHPCPQSMIDLVQLRIR